MTAGFFFDSIKGKRVAFIGVGVSHNDMIKQFAKKKLSVTVCDRRTKEELGALADKFEALGVRLSLGEGYMDNIAADIIIRTPGLYYNNELLQKYRAGGAVVTSEMELFFELCP